MFDARCMPSGSAFAFIVATFPESPIWSSRGIAPSFWSMDAFGMAMIAREVLGLNQTRSFGRRSSIATSTAITAREYAWKRSVGTSKQYGNVRSTLEWSG